MSHRRARIVLALVLGLPLTVAMSAAATAPQATSRQAATAPRGTASPQGGGSHHGPRYGPYFETWTSVRASRWWAGKSGARYYLAFLQTPRKGSCTVAWNGDRKARPSVPAGAGSHGIAEAPLRWAGT